MIAIDVEAARWMRRQPGIMVGFLDQVFRAATLAVKPDYEGNGIRHVSDEDSICVLAGFEQLVLFGFLGTHLLRRFFVAQSHEPVCLLPSVRLVEKFALRISVGLLGRLPLGLS